MSDVLAGFDSGGARVELRQFCDGDEASFVACYNAVFPADDPGVPPINVPFWRWKYDAAPSGGRREIVVAEHATLGIVGAYPCQPLRVWCEGRERRSAQITDLMVRHEFRRAGPRPGLFVHLGRAFYDCYCGKDDDRQFFNYGWPIPAWRMGQRYLRYENVRDWNFLAREIAADEAPRPTSGELEARAVEQFGRDTDALYDRVKHAATLSVVKDSAWLNWRYAQHPTRSYLLLECRSKRDDALRGVAVYTIGDFRRPNTSFLVDWVVDADDMEAIVALVAACEQRALRDETGAIAGIWSPADPRFALLQGLGYQVWDSRYFVVIAAFQHDTFFFRNAWQFTMGESDLV